MKGEWRQGQKERRPSPATTTDAPKGEFNTAYTLRSAVNARQTKYIFRDKATQNDYHRVGQPKY